MIHTLPIADVLKNLNSSQGEGLTKGEAEKRLLKDGYNEIPEPKKESPLSKFFEQFKDILVLLLIGATIISFLLGEHVDAIAILAIVLLNATLGFIQEYKAEKAIEALKKLSTSYTKVLRDGDISRIESRYLVSGDIVLLEAGDKVPADARLLEQISLEVSEAILTGESVPVKKTLEPLSNENLTLGDRKNLLFKDTSIVNGRAKAIVYATGIESEVGKISQLLKDESAPRTPLQVEMEKVGKNLSFAALAIILVIFFIEIIFETESLRSAFLTSVSLAVAAIPEGLPAVITLVLAIGVSRLVKKKAIIRKLPAVETLGATTHILTDKTGTLTQNRMNVTKIVTTNAEYTVEGVGYNPTGSFFDSLGNKINPKDIATLKNVLEAGVLCNDAEHQYHEDKNEYLIIGDITEGALIVCAERAGIKHEVLRHTRKRLFEVPFSSELKYMVTAHENPDTEKVDITMKGATEAVVNFINADDNEKKRIIETTNSLASQGLRNICFAQKEITREEFEKLNSETDKTKLYSNLSYIGIAGEKDPLRPEVKDAIMLAQNAGVTTIMVTGDHKLTAVAIGKELGIAISEGDAISGEELSKVPDEKFDDTVKNLRIFARVSPQQKLQLVKSFKRQKHIVAVTGDGVNDAPAIKAADIGVSMGIEGTDVAKEASDMVLQDDNYATIVSAIREGRIIFDNLIKFITYLISCNISEILIILLAAFLKLPVPLLPIHLLWINLVTDGFPALALGMEPGESDIMNRKPRSTRFGILTKDRWAVMAVEGSVIGSLSFVAFLFAMNNYGIDVARTVAFLTISLCQLVHSLNSRSEKKSLLSMGITGNRVLFYVFMLSVAAQFPIIYTKVGEMLFRATPLSVAQLVPVVVITILFVGTVEFLKLLRRRTEYSQAK